MHNCMSIGYSVRFLFSTKVFLELANWYFWAMDNVQFLTTLKEKDVRNATNLIRNYTGNFYLVYQREKLVPANLFRKNFGQDHKDFAK